MLLANDTINALCATQAKPLHIAQVAIDCISEDTEINFKFVEDQTLVSQGKCIDVGYWIDHIIEQGLTAYIYDMIDIMTWCQHSQLRSLKREYDCAMMRQIENNLINQTCDDIVDDIDAFFTQYVEKKNKIDISLDTLFLF